MALLNALGALLDPKRRGRGSRRPRRPRPVNRRLQLEPLEDRCLLSGGISLTPSEPAPQLVGEPITWTATVSDLGANPVYQFRAGPEHGPLQMVRDFSVANSFTWTPMEEGTYDIQVIAKQGSSATGTESVDALDVVNSRVTGSDAVITPTLNPLVALYSVPPTQPGPGPHGAVHVEFAVAGDNPSWRTTNDLPSHPGKSTNFFVAGMLPDTTYEMRDVFSDGSTSAPLLFTTGGIPSNLSFPTYTVQQPPVPGSDLDQGLIFQQFPNSPSNTPNPVATDLNGRVVWYYDAGQAGLTHTYVGQSLAPGGTVLVLGVDRYAPLPATLDVLREIDLAGNTARETNMDAVNAQLAALGDHAIFTFTHDVQRLPNGDTAVIGATERTVNVNGAPTEYVGMSIIVLDQNLQVAWVWDSFDHLDVNRGPILGDALLPGGADQLTASTPVLPVVDWLHANAVSWSPEDGNLVVSLRAQDWVIKIDYANGAGDGHVVWRLGQGGDFTVNSADPGPWFSHQHDPHFIDDTTLVVFDNGNTRRASDPTADSRGQVWKIDEQTMTATLVLNVDMGGYSPMFGAAQRLSNGDYSFLSGGQGAGLKQSGQLIEVRPDGSRAYVLADNKWVFRSFRVQTLYEGISDRLAGAPLKVASVVINDGSAQRSMVDRITVTFDGAAVLDPGAIELRRQDGSLVDAQVSISLVDGRTVAVLTFAGPEFVGGSLADGQYTLTVRADRVHDRFGRELDGDRVESFFRLFGDADGDGHVGVDDLLRFVRTFGKRAGDPGYLWYFDYDGDGRVDVGDLFELLRRFER